MEARTPDPQSLDDIERAPVDRLRALQRQRMSEVIGPRVGVERDRGDRLVALIKNQIGATVAVDVLPPGGFGRSVGEMRRIIDNRPTA